MGVTGRDGHSGIANSVVQNAANGGLFFALTLLTTTYGKEYIVHARVHEWTGWVSPDSILQRLGFHPFKQCGVVTGGCHWLAWAKVLEMMPGVLDPQTVFAVNAGFDDFVRHIGAAIPEILRVERNLHHARFRFPWDVAQYQPVMVETGEKFFPSGREYDAFKNLTDIVAGAEHSVFLIDPYADEDTIEFLAHAKAGVLKVLTHKLQGQFTAHASRLKRQLANVGKTLEVRQANEFHDRFLACDSTVFHIGTSLNSLGTRAFMLAPIQGEAVAKAVLRFAGDTWNLANQVPL